MLYLKRLCVFILRIGRYNRKTKHEVPSTNLDSGKYYANAPTSLRNQHLVMAGGS